MPINEETFQKLLDFLIANAVNKALTLSLSDSLGANVIHVDSNIPQELNLSITNILTKEVRIVGQPGPASPENYHFNIKFVSNQCFFSSVPPTLINPQWSMKAVPEAGPGYIMDLYLLSTVDINLRPVSVAGGSTTTVQLQYTDVILANPEVEILQIGVTVGQNVFAIVNSDRQPVTGTETVHLTTFTDAGVPTPLVATLVQPRTILANQPDRSQSLLLRLVNTSPEPVTFTPPSGNGGKTPTSIQLAIDVDGAAAWALCKSDETDALVVDRPANWNEEPIPDTAGQKTWLLRPDYKKTTQIPHNSALEFPIHGIKTSLPPGFTNLYVTLREFPNYGTQTLVAQIEKSPLIYNSELNSGLVSNGATGEHQGLAINGDTTVDLLMVNQSGGGSSAHFKGGNGVNIEGDARINDHTLWFRPGSDKFHGIGFYGSGKPFANTDVNGPAVFGFLGGVLGSNAGEQKIALSWRETGNVGIGTSDPKSTLSVKGGAAVGATYAASVAKPNNLIVEGSVGIGTNDPKSTLSVKGGAAVGATYAASVAKPNELIVEGKVGIGTNDPKHKLEVAGGSIQLDGSQQIIFTNEGVTNQLKLQFWGGFGLGLNANTQFYTASIHSWRDTNSNEAMSLNSGTRDLTINGKVGIGTAPTKAGLEVASNVLYNSANISGGLVASNGCYSNAQQLTGGRNVSIYTDSLVWINSWVIASSDLRLKHVHGVSDGAADLNTLLGIEVTDYSYIDWISKGTATHKKLIAQQLMRVFPQAVSKCTNAVPDIYETAAIHDGWVQLATNLKTGERVRLIGEKNESIHEVLEIAEGKFRTDFETESSQVFVFGREVDDFLNVDYDAIAMLNVSATQQIKREKDAEVQALREENAELRARLERLENLIEEKLDHKRAQTAQMS
jgi:hypothetical protein